MSISTGGFPVSTNDRTVECWVYINSFIPGFGANFAFYGAPEDGEHIVWEYMRMNDCFFHSGV